MPFLKTLKNTVAFPIQQVAICGDPDYILCVYGRFVALELKASGGVPRALQVFKLERVKKAGGIAIVATPENWDEIKQQLSAMDEGVLWKPSKE